MAVLYNHSQHILWVWHLTILHEIVHIKLQRLTKTATTPLFLNLRDSPFKTLTWMLTGTMHSFDECEACSHSTNCSLLQIFLTQFQLLESQWGSELVHSGGKHMAVESTRWHFNTIRVFFSITCRNSTPAIHAALNQTITALSAQWMSEKDAYSAVLSWSCHSLCLVSLLSTVNFLTFLSQNF